MRSFKHLLVVLGVLAASCGGQVETAASDAVTTTEAVEVEATTSTEAEVEAAAEPEVADAEEEEPVVEESETEPVVEPELVTTEEAAAAAATNIELLAGGSTVFDYEVLDVQNGSISSLEQAVDGDRSVLLWFFAPH